MKNTMKKPVAIPVEKLRPFAGHPFKVKDDDEMNTLIESIQRKVLLPLIVRPIEIQMNRGHKRSPPLSRTKGRDHRGPCLDLCPDRDCAVAVVDSNLHRAYFAL